MFLVRRFLYCIHECILMYNYCTGTVSMSLVYFPKIDLRMWRARATLRNDQPAVTDFLEEAILQGNIHWIIARTGKPISIFVLCAATVHSKRLFAHHKCLAGRQTPSGRIAPVERRLSVAAKLRHRKEPCHTDTCGDHKDPCRRRTTPRQGD